MPECNCRDYGFSREDGDDHHDNGCAVALDREADKLDKALKRAKKRIGELQRQTREVRTVLRKAHRALEYTARYLDKEDSPSVVRIVDNALLATAVATSPRTKKKD